jgi:acyl-CoA dehydrogenase
MTEPAVASSDATNIQSEIKRDGDHYVINGRKWWTSGAPDKRCKIAIFMGQTDPSARRTSGSRWCWCPWTRPA